MNSSTVLTGKSFFTASPMGVYSTMERMTKSSVLKDASSMNSGMRMVWGRLNPPMVYPSGFADASLDQQSAPPAPGTYCMTNGTPSSFSR